MHSEKALEDMTTREAQLCRHLMSSEDYLQKFQREFRRQVWILYLCIVLLILFQSFYAWQFTHVLDPDQRTLVLATTLLAIVNCMLLVRTKTWLRRLNEKWIDPREKAALDALRLHKHEIDRRITQAQTPEQ